MGDHTADGSQDEMHNTTSGKPLTGVQDKVKGATDSTLSTLDRASSWVLHKGQSLLDTIFPPDKREAFLAKLKAFILANPKLSAFLGMNLALTGIPLGLFVLYSLSVFIFSLVVGIIVGLLGAVSFTLLAVGAALLVVFPTVLFTTSAACFLFLWGLGGYYFLRWASKSPQSDPKQVPPGQVIGDTLSRITGGKLDGFMHDTRQHNAAQPEHAGTSSTHTVEKRNGTSQHSSNENPTSAIKKEVGNVGSTLTKSANGTTRPVNNATGTLNTTKSAVSGATALPA